MIQTKVFLLALTLLMSTGLHADEFSWATGFKVGDRFPNSNLVSSDGDTVSTESIAGENGFLVQFNRSVVW